MADKNKLNKEEAISEELNEIDLQEKELAEKKAKLRDLVKDTFAYYSEVTELLVFEDGTSFLRENENFARNYALNSKQKYYVINR